MSRKNGSSAQASLPEHGLPKAELEVLAAIVNSGETRASEIRKALGKFRPMTHGSIVKLLMRLEARQLVDKRKGDVGKAFIYHATSKSKAVFRRLTSEMVRRVFGGSRVDVVSQILDAQLMSADELRRLFPALGRRR